MAWCLTTPGRVCNVRRLATGVLRTPQRHINTRVNAVLRTPQRHINTRVNGPFSFGIARDFSTDGSKAKTGELEREDEAKIDKEIKDVTEQLAPLAEDIAKVTNAIEKVDAALALGPEEDEKRYLRKKEEQLRKEKEQLRKEKEQLREKEQLLRKEKQLHNKEKTPGNRTVYLGGFVEGPEMNVTQVLDAICGLGLIDQVKALPAKKCLFVSFVEGADAAAFMNTFGREGMHLKAGAHLKVGWGKPHPLPNDIMASVRKGATRSLFLGNIDESVSQDSLQVDLGGFGLIEKVDVLEGKKIAFVHFLSITSAMAAHKELRDPNSTLSQKGYNKFRANFGKDRCATAPRGRGGPGGAPRNFGGPPPRAHHPAPAPAVPRSYSTPNYEHYEAPPAVTNPYLPPVQNQMAPMGYRTDQPPAY